MESSRHKNGDKLRQSVRARQYMDIAQAVEHQHTKDSGWQEFAKILHKGGCFSLKMAKGRKRVSIVPAIYKPIVIICCVIVIG